ncbi:MAG: NAD(P)-dependent oxidoreductase [Firmicutes bacterium]|nr:NAD(P)-dependent oxidoreductase [Bacillota bacterium]
MDILLTGQLSYLTGAVSEAMIAGGHNVAYASDDIDTDYIGKKVTPFHISPCSDDFERIFNSYNFNVVLFFSQGIYQKDARYNEYQALENLLRICTKHEINQFIYLQPKHCGTESNRIPEHDLAVLFESLDTLCDYYIKSKGMSIIKLNIPSVYGYGEKGSVVGNAIYQARTTSAVHLYGAKDQRLAFISERDLGEILLRICESWTLVYDRLDIPAGDIMTFNEFGELLKGVFSTVRLSYTACPVTADTDFDGTAVKKEYDWIPIFSIRQELSDVINSVENKSAPEKVGFKEKLSAFISRHSFVVKLTELIIGFLITELLLRVTSTTVQFNYIDFRLLYIVIMGTMHGMKTGLAASALASISLLSAFISGHSKWEAVAFDIDTWLPYIFFFLVGAVTGYVKDRLRNDNRSLKREMAVLEDKYVTLNEFYMSALNNKEQYRTQIMSYRDSFGRLFEITKKLDSTTVEHVFLEALYALEGVLDNHSICIYRCEDSMQYARLIICSKEVFNITEKSLKLFELPEMMPMLADGSVWVNRDRLVGYPEYAVALYHDDKPIALITLKKATHEQLSVYYENLIKIICGLIKISLIRAIEYNSKIETEKYIPGSSILKNEYFAELIKNKEEMAQSGTSEYVLLRIDTGSMDQADVANKIIPLIRNTDEFGLGKNGELYLCLSQTNNQNIRFLLERLKKSGLNYGTVDAEEREGGSL